MKEYEKSPQNKEKRHSSQEKPKVNNEPGRTQAEVSLSYNSQKSASWRERYKNIGNKHSSQQVAQAAVEENAAPKGNLSGGTTIAQTTITVPIPASIKDNAEEIWIQYYLQKYPGTSRGEAKAWFNRGRSRTTQIKPGDGLLELRGPYKDVRGEYFVIVEESIYEPGSPPTRVGDIPPPSTSPEYVPSKPQTDLLSPVAPTPENRPQGAPVKIEEWIPFTVEVDEENPTGLILIPPASSRDLPIKLPTRVWDNQKYEIVRVLRYKTGLQDEYIKGREIYLLPRDVVKIPLFSYENSASRPLQPQPGTHKVDNTEIFKQQLSQLPGEVKYLLGGEQSFQPENHQRLLKIGNQIQQLSPEQFRYYKPIANQFVGNLDSLERSIDVFTRTRDIVSQQLQGEQTNDIAAQINNQLFVIQSVITNSVWQQFLKDLIASIVESPKYVGDELQQLFEVLKDHWVQFIALIAAFALAEGLVLFLTGLPEPTFLSKVIAVAIQGILYTIYGIDIVVSVASTVNELMNWWNAVSIAKGDPKKIEQASRAFLRMIGNLILLFLSSKDFQKKLSAENREKLLAMLRRQSQPLTPSLPGEKPPSVMDLTYDPETKSYVVKSKPNPDTIPVKPS